MGFAPREIDAMTFAEFEACVDGYNRANGGKSGPKEMTESEMDEAEALLDAAERRNAMRLARGN
jgi:hypothetical protein